MQKEKEKEKRKRKKVSYHITRQSHDKPAIFEPS